MTVATVQTVLVRVLPGLCVGGAVGGVVGTVPACRFRATASGPFSNGKMPPGCGPAGNPPAMMVRVQLRFSVSVVVELKTDLVLVLVTVTTTGPGGMATVGVTVGIEMLGVMGPA